MAEPNPTSSMDTVQAYGSKIKRLLSSLAPRSAVMIVASLCLTVLILSGLQALDQTRTIKSKSIVWYTGSQGEGIANREVLYVSDEKTEKRSHEWTDYELEDFPVIGKPIPLDKQDQAWLNPDSNSAIVVEENMEAQGQPQPPPQAAAPQGSGAQPPKPAWAPPASVGQQPPPPPAEAPKMDLGVEEKEIKAFGIPTLVYDGYAKSADSRPAIVFIHGGGWVGGTAALDHAQPIIKELGAVVFSVNYRLAPQNPYPTPFEDCFTVVKYVLSKAAEHNVDPKRVSLMGGSSGANIAAAISYAFTQPPASENFPPLRAQILVSPVLQALDFRTPSYQWNNSEVSHIAREDMIRFWSLYANGYDIPLRNAMEKNEHVPGTTATYYAQTQLNHVAVPKDLQPSFYKPNTYTKVDVEVWNKAKTTLLDPRFAPLMAEQFRGLPPTFIYAAMRDVARDDALMYKAALEKAGVKVELYLDPRGFHGAFWSTDNRNVVYKKVADFIY